jgi:hypothetical protein
MNSDNLNSGETLYVFYATQLDNDTALYARDRQNGIRFKVWQCEDGYFEAELINKMKYSLANGGRTLEQLYDNIKHDFIDIWFNFAECDTIELTEDALDFRKFVLELFELEKCDV